MKGHFCPINFGWVLQIFSCLLHLLMNNTDMFENCFQERLADCSPTCVKAMTAEVWKKWPMKTITHCFLILDMSCMTAFCLCPVERQNTNDRHVSVH